MKLDPPSVSIAQKRRRRSVPSLIGRLFLRVTRGDREMTGQRFCRPHRLAVPSVGQTATRPRFADRTSIYLAEGSEASGFWAFCFPHPPSPFLLLVVFNTPAVGGARRRRRQRVTSAGAGGAHFPAAGGAATVAPPPTHTEPWPPNHLGCPGTEKKEKKRFCVWRRGTIS